MQKKIYKLGWIVAFHDEPIFYKPIVSEKRPLLVFLNRDDARHIANFYGGRYFPCAYIRSRKSIPVRDFWGNVKKVRPGNAPEGRALASEVILLKIGGRNDQTK